jgi:hypothetical protein
VIPNPRSYGSGTGSRYGHAILITICMNKKTKVCVIRLKQSTVALFCGASLVLAAQEGNLSESVLANFFCGVEGDYWA